MLLLVLYSMLCTISDYGQKGARDEPHGQNSSQDPTGLSSRAKYAYGFTGFGREETIRAANFGRGGARVVVYCLEAKHWNFWIASCGGMYF